MLIKYQSWHGTCFIKLVQELNNHLIKYFIILGG